MLSQAADNSLGEKSMNISGLNYTKSEESNPYFWPQLTAHFTATNCMQMQLSPTKASSEWQLLYQQDRWYKGKSIYSLPHAKSCPFRSWRDWTPRSRNHSSDQAVFSWKKKKIQKRKKPQNIHIHSYFFFLQHVNSALDFSPTLWGTRCNTLVLKTIIIH